MVSSNSEAPADPAGQRQAGPARRCQTCAWACEPAAEPSVFDKSASASSPDWRVELIGGSEQRQLARPYHQNVRSENELPRRFSRFFMPSAAWRVRDRASADLIYEAAIASHVPSC